MSDIQDKIVRWADGFREKHGYSPAWFLRYAAGGVITAIVEFAAFLLFSYWKWPWLAIVSLLPKGLRASAADELQLWAIVVSNIISYVFNYFISKYWVFHSPETKHRRDALLFAVSSLSNLTVVLVSAKLLLLGLDMLPISGALWESSIAPIIAKIGSNAAAFVTVLIFKRFIIWKDTSKY